MVLLLTAFRMAWPAFAFSISDDEEAKRTYAWVLTYLVVIASWVAPALALLSPWLVRLLTKPAFYAGSQVVAPLAFATVAYAGYIVMAIGVGRAKRTQFNWVIAGAAALLNVALNLLLIPPVRDDGRRRSHGRRVLPMFVRHGLVRAARLPRAVPVAPGGDRGRAGRGARGRQRKLLDVGLAVALLLALAYPLALAPLGFFLPGERARLRALVAR